MLRRPLPATRNRRDRRAGRARIRRALTAHVGSVLMLSSVLAAGSVGTWTGERIVLAEGPSDARLPSTFSIVTWNVAKGGRSVACAAAEIQALAASSDILCVQEFVPSLMPSGAFSCEFASSFRPPLAEEPNGVGILARSAPTSVQVRSSQWKEGWVLTPKMSLFAHYPLGGAGPDGAGPEGAGHDGVELLVVNLHGLNFQPVFTYGLREQMRHVTAALERHDGPVVVCGDFNTWRRDRLALVEGALEGLDNVPFDGLVRTGARHLVRLAGGDPALPLDHVFVRGLSVVDASVVPTVVSDHVPLRVTLRYDAP